MGITHVLNAAAPCDPLLETSEPTEQEDLFPAWSRFYANMKITYCALPATCHQFNMIRYFMPAARFMANALREPENKLLIHCRDGVNQSPTLFLAYLTMYCNMCLEEAVDHLVRVRHIQPLTDFLFQLAFLESKPSTCQEQMDF
ncbi:hypothetical protein DNTS_035553 [Danionella cerebrum]|uniref:Tyrosine specific protein phosphatases domain-containing protein n=1 Tax=Danionella cerebrum TaxID=2873325 RepID=A0A553NRE1_9TELE|nr:hypothetical protein DNTS_035553 [Danionella translucida]